MNLLIDIPIIIAVAATTDIIMVTVLWTFYSRKFKPLIRFAKQYMSHLGVKSQEVQHEHRAVIRQKETKEKLAKGFVKELPFGGTLQRVMEAQGISGEEIFEVVQDEKFMKGVMVIINTFGNIVGKVTGKKEGEESTGIQPPSTMY